MIDFTAASAEALFIVGSKLYGPRHGLDQVAKTPLCLAQPPAVVTMTIDASCPPLGLVLVRM